MENQTDGRTRRAPLLVEDRKAKGARLLCRWSSRRLRRSGSAGRRRAKDRFYRRGLASPSSRRRRGCRPEPLADRRSRETRRDRPRPSTSPFKNAVASPYPPPATSGLSPGLPSRAWATASAAARDYTTVHMVSVSDQLTRRAKLRYRRGPIRRRSGPRLEANLQVRSTC